MLLGQAAAVFAMTLRAVPMKQLLSPGSGFRLVSERIRSGSCVLWSPPILILLVNGVLPVQSSDQHYAPRHPQKPYPGRYPYQRLPPKSCASLLPNPRTS
jgi:hypothetical protein